MEEEDADGSGEFSFLEFVYLVKRLRQIRKQRREMELKELFKQYDKDGSGELGPQEISLILEDFDLLPKSKEEQEEIASTLEEIDEDGSGNIEFAEFQIFMERVREKLERMKREEERTVAKSLGFDDSKLASFRSAFETLDPEGWGSLGISDVRQVMRMLRVNITSDALRALFDHLDDDESGQMEMGEFLQLMHGRGRHVSHDHRGERDAGHQHRRLHGHRPAPFGRVRLFSFGWFDRDRFPSGATSLRLCLSGAGCEVAL